MKDSERLERALHNLGNFLDYSEWLGRIPSAKSADPYERRMAYWLVHMKQARSGSSTCRWYEELATVAQNRGFTDLFVVDSRKVNPFKCIDEAIGSLTVTDFCSTLSRWGQTMMVCCDESACPSEVPVYELLCRRDMIDWDNYAKQAKPIIGAMMGCWEIMGFYAPVGKKETSWIARRFDGDVYIVNRITLPSFEDLLRYTLAVKGKTYAQNPEIGIGADDMTGEKAGNWTVIGLSGHVERDENVKGNKEYLWYCVCKCGTISKVAGGKLRNGKSKSCGCYRKVVLSRKAATLEASVS